MSGIKHDIPLSSFQRIAHEIPPLWKVDECQWEYVVIASGMKASRYRTTDRNLKALEVPKDGLPALPHPARQSAPKDRQKERTNELVH